MSGISKAKNTIDAIYLIKHRPNINHKLNLQYADLWNANLWNANLRNVDLRNTNLRNADLRNADLQNADLWNANLWSADLRNANLRNANLRNANLQYANLQYADLWNANLRNADLRNTNLRNADIDYSCWPLWCGSNKVKIDRKIFIQLLSHLAMVNVNDKDCEKIIQLKLVQNLISEFHHKNEVF